MNKILLSLALIFLSFPAYADMTKARKYMEAENFEAAFSEYLHSAREGNMFAQYIVAQMYARGEGIKRDMREAANWYGLAADRGHLKSQNNLANMYMDGFGVMQNFSEAARWFKRAAERGNYLSMASLAELYQHGEGVGQNFEQAIILYHKAAENSVRKAMNNLGFIHFGGHGVKQSYQLAYTWFSVAEYAGDTQGSVNKFDMNDYLNDNEKSQAELAAQKWLADHPNALNKEETLE